MDARYTVWIAKSRLRRELRNDAQEAAQVEAYRCRQVATSAILTVVAIVLMAVTVWAIRQP